MSKENADIEGLLPHVRTKVKEFQRLFPDFDVISGHRSREYNASVGGAKNSRHIHRDAFDFKPNRAMSDERKADAVNWLRSQGANGFGTYNSGSFHADWRSSPAMWGNSRRSDSLSQTPGWYQRIAQDHVAGRAPPTQFNTIPPGSIPDAGPARGAPAPAQARAPQIAPLPQRPAGAVPTPPARPQGLLPGMPPGLVQQIAQRIAPEPQQAPAPQPQALPQPQAPQAQPQGQERRGWPYQSLWDVAREGVSDLWNGPQAPTPAAAPAPTPAPQNVAPQPVTPQPIPGPTVMNAPPRQVRDVGGPGITFVPGAPVQGPEMPQARNVPLPPQRPGQDQLFPQMPQTAAQAPLPPADNPLVIRNIRPQRPEAQMVPLPPQRPSNDQLFPQMPQRAQGVLPQPMQPQRQGSTPTIWGANWHGPESGLINRAQAPAGQPYPDVWTGPSPYPGTDPFAGGGGGAGGLLGLLGF